MRFDIKVLARVLTGPLALAFLSGCTSAPKSQPVVITDQYGTDLRDLPTVETDLDKATEAQLPRDINDAVVKWIDYFEGKGRPHMERYLSRSTRYLPLMKDILRREGLPEDLVYLALIESGFSSQARSHAGAVGYWQFIRDTGRLYDLEINRMVDERKDPIKSTEAAARYLKGLYNLFGSWYLAIAAYNVGENKVRRMVMKNYTRDFWELARRRKLPRETIDYVPKFIAAKLMAKDPIKYGFTSIDYATPFTFAELTASQSVDLNKFAEGLGLSQEEIQNLNPSFRTQYAPLPKSHNLVLRVPVASKEKAQTVLSQSFVTLDESVHGYESFRYVRVRTKRGEDLADLARRFETSVGSIRRANRLGRRVSRVRVGTALRIPVGSMPLVLKTREDGTVVGQLPEFESAETSKRSAKSRRGPSSTPAAQPTGKTQTYVVRQGDTLTGIARRYKISLQELTHANALHSRSRINVGARLVIPD